jgi:hypothetical protein
VELSPAASLRTQTSTYSSLKRDPREFMLHFTRILTEFLLRLIPSRNEDVFISQVPGLCTELINTPVDWNYTATTIPSRTDVHYARGKLLGGCSSHSK